jgi:hypothetical protein
MESTLQRVGRVGCARRISVVSKYAPSDAAPVSQVEWSCQHSKAMRLLETRRKNDCAAAHQEVASLSCHVRFPSLFSHGLQDRVQLKPLPRPDRMALAGKLTFSGGAETLSA